MKNEGPMWQSKGKMLHVQETADKWLRKLEQQHEINADLLAALTLCLGNLVFVAEQTGGYFKGIEVARAAIAKAKAAIEGATDAHD